MEKEFRIKKLADIKNKDETYMTGIPGEVKNFDAYKIPLKYLIYNRQGARKANICSLCNK
jgi:hypothetical protein